MVLEFKQRQFNRRRRHIIPRWWPSKGTCLRETSVQTAEFIWTPIWSLEMQWALWPYSETYISPELQKNMCTNLNIFYKRKVMIHTETTFTALLLRPKMFKVNPFANGKTLRWTWTLSCILKVVWFSQFLYQVGDVPYGCVGKCYLNVSIHSWVNSVLLNNGVEIVACLCGDRTSQKGGYYWSLEAIRWQWGHLQHWKVTGI